MNISLVLKMAAETFPERRALTRDGVHYSYDQLLAAAQNAAARISASEASYVAFLGENSPATVIALFGAALAAKPFVPLSYRLTQAETTRLVERLHPAFLIADADMLATIPASDAVMNIESSAFLAKMLEPERLDWHMPHDTKEVAVQLFTSGTTGEPKAALLHHDNLLSYILRTIEFGSSTQEEANLISVPPYHIAGIAAILSSIYALRRIVQLPRFSAEQWLSYCVAERVTNAFVVPTMLARIIAHLEKTDPAFSMPALRAIAYGGGKMPAQVIDTALRLFPDVAFTNAYGLTETSSTISLLSPEDHRTAHGHPVRAIAGRLGSVGRPLPTVEVEIRDENGKRVAVGEPGEVYVSGPQVSGRYKEKSLLDADGWFPTRDAGYIDEHGYLFLSGRIDDVIVRGGENISPAEIEDVLRSHRAVADVAVIGVPSVEWGETIGAVVALKPNQSVAPATLRDLVRRQLRSSRVPEKLLFVDAIPYNDMGKLLRRNLKVLFDA